VIAEERNVAFLRLFGVRWIC